MSESVHTSANVAHLMLIVMGIIYSIRIWWLMRFPLGRDRQGHTGNATATPTKGILYSWVNIAMPWAMESSRKHFLLYLQFVLFHLGVASAIALSFIIPFAPGLLAVSQIVIIMQVIIGAAGIVGIVRMVRRISNKYLRSISTPDDYFSLLLLTVWFFFATFSVDIHNNVNETILLIYFYMTAFFLLYVPFSKISHYLYYPFTRYYFGKTMGYRGIYPMANGHRMS